MDKNLARFSSLRFLLSAGFGSLAFILVGLTFGWVLVTVRGQLRQGFFTRLQNAVNLAAIQIDGDLHASLITVRQESSAEYQQIKAILQRVVAQDEDFLAARSLRLIQNRAFVVVDADKRSDQMLHMLDAVPGLDEQNLKRLNDMTSGFVIETPLKDPAGDVLAAFAPIYSAGGVFDGFLMLSIPAETLARQERVVIGWMLGGAILVAGLLAAAGFGVGRLLSDLLTGLAESAEANRQPALAGSAVQPHKGVPARLLLNHPLGEISRLAEAISPVEPAIESKERPAQTREQMLELQTAGMQQNLADIHLASMVAAAASAQLDPATMPDLVVTLLVNQFEVDQAAFFVVETGGDWLALKAARGFARKPLANRVAMGDRLAGQAAETRQIQVAALDGERGAELALPLVSEQRTLGVIVLQSEKGDYFGEQRCSIFQAMADQISVAYRNAQLFAQSSQALKDMQRSYQQLTQAAWEGFLQERSRFGYRASESGVEAVGLQQAVELAAQDPAGQRMLRLPVSVRGKPVGFLNASRIENGPAWGQEDVELLETLTQQLSVALDNARLYSATQRSVERERVLSEITSQVRASTSVDMIMQTAVRQLAQALNAPQGAIRLHGAEVQRGAGEVDTGTGGAKPEDGQP